MVIFSKESGPSRPFRTASQGSVVKLGSGVVLWPERARDTTHVGVGKPQKGCLRHSKQTRLKEQRFHLTAERRVSAGC